MSELEQLQKELEEIKQELKSLVPNSLAYKNLSAIKAEIEAQLFGSGAVAQGQGAKAVGANGISIEGDFSGNIRIGNHRLAGDSSTDAPQPSKKKKRNRNL